MNTKKFLIMLSFVSFASTYIILTWNKDHNKAQETIEQSEYSEHKINPRKEYNREPPIPEGFNKFIAKFLFYPIILSFSKENNIEVQFLLTTNNNKVTLEPQTLVQTKAQMFIMVPNLAFPQKYKHCVSFVSVTGINNYLTTKNEKINIIPYQEDPNYKLNASFCLYPKDEFFAVTKAGFVISTLAKRNHVLTHNVKKYLFIDRNIYIKKSKYILNNIKKIIQIEKVARDFIPKEISFRSSDGAPIYYKYNNKERKYVPHNNILSEKLFFQKVNVKVQHITTDNQNTHNHNHHTLGIDLSTLKATTKKKSSYDMSFIIIPSLSKSLDNKRDCISLASFSIKEYFLTNEERVLVLNKNDYTPDFAKKASFCIEKNSIDHYRLESASDFSYFVDNHTFDDDNFHFLKNNSQESIHSIFSFEQDFNIYTNKNYTVAVDDIGTSKTYLYHQKKNLFVRKNKTQDQIELSKEFNTDLSQEILTRMICEISSRKHKVYYRSFKIGNYLALRFLVNKEDAPYLDQIECKIPQPTIDKKIKISCDANGNLINFEKDCSLHITKEGITSITPPGKWDIAQHTSNPSQQNVKNDNTPQLIYIKLVSNAQKFSGDIKYCHIQTESDEYQHLSSLVKNRKLLLSFRVPKNSLNHIANLQCELGPQENLLGGFFQCNIELISQSEINADDCKL